MTRKEQIEQLAKAWEALGDGRESVLDGHALILARSTHPHDTCIATIWTTNGTDPNDATPALAILRDVYGEDVDVFHIRDEDGESWNVGPVEAGTCYYSVSFVSRIDSVTLALEAKKPMTVRGGV